MSILGLSGGSGKYIRFQPSINAWVFEKEELQLKKILFDLDSVKTGWGLMMEGQAPTWVWDEALGKRAMKPEGEFKRGFSVKLYLGPQRGWAEWSSTGTGSCMGFEALYDAALKEKDANPGMALVASYNNSRAERIGKGTTRVPLFEIVGWADKPADDADEDEAPAPKQAAKAPPATGSKPVGAPAKKMATADSEDFG